MNLSGNYEHVSLRLMRILDTVGLDEDQRWRRINTWLQAEEVRTYELRMRRKGAKIHYFGSAPEATTTAGLNGDLDIVCLRESDIVLQDFPPLIPEYQIHIIVIDEGTPAGYVKLQALSRDIPVLNDHHWLDMHGRSLLLNCSNRLKLPDGYKHHGPANTGHFGNVSIDLVPALCVDTWPQQTLRWLTRVRKYNWPPQETISIIRQSRVLLVPVGHKSSAEQHLEWRLSFSYAEKILVWMFNETQYKCYVMLKVIKKSFIDQDGVDNVLTSYHCKTCMFYMIENTQQSFWQAKNLLLCIELCLKQLLSWVESINCPNYFIPEENMFQSRLRDNNKGQLADSIRGLLRQMGEYLFMIPFDNIGEKLVDVYHVPVMDIATHQKDLTLLAKAIFHLIYALRDCFLVLPFFAATSNTHLRDRLKSVREPRKEVLVILQTMTVCYSPLRSQLASTSSGGGTVDIEMRQLKYELLMAMSTSFDAASGKLKLAAFHWMQDDLDIFEDILSHVVNIFASKVYETDSLIEMSSLHKITGENLSTTDVLRQLVAFPVMYLPSEINSTPKALIFEMFRSTGSDRGSLHSDIYYCRFQSAVVSPKFYLCFLQYQCKRLRNKLLQRMVAISNMIATAMQIKLRYRNIQHITHMHFHGRINELFHLETVLNLLAYCLKQEGQLLGSFNILCMSMMFQNEHNAAKWQIATFLNSAFRVSRSSQ